ncbi:MAG: hypothetical protein ACOCVZ_01845 [Gemmatimonadota bacterium]
MKILLVAATSVLFLVPFLTLAGCSDSPMPPEVTDGARFEAPALGDAGSAALAATPERPIKMSFVIWGDPSDGFCEVQIPGGPLVPIPVLLLGKGTVSHLGRSTTEIRHLECDFDHERGVITVGGPFETMAANGDTVYGEWEGYLNLFGEDAGTFINTAEFTGGTGRFSGASGDVDIRGWKDLSDPAAAGWFEATGTIAY